MADEQLKSAAERLAEQAARFEAVKLAREAAAQRAQAMAAIGERQATLRAEVEARAARARREESPYVAPSRAGRPAREPRPRQSGGVGRRFAALGASIGRAAASPGRRLRNIKKGPGGFEVRSKQVLAALLLPFLFIAGMGVTTALFQTVMSILSGVGLSNNVITTMIQISVGTGLFLLLIYAAFKWVKTGGLGILG